MLLLKTALRQTWKIHWRQNSSSY